MQDEISELIGRAGEGDKKALEDLLISVQDMIYNLSLRMLGSPHDAEGEKVHFPHGSTVSHPII